MVHRQQGWSVWLCGEGLLEPAQCIAAESPIDAGVTRNQTKRSTPSSQLHRASGRSGVWTEDGAEQVPVVMVARDREYGDAEGIDRTTQCFVGSGRRLVDQIAECGAAVIR